MSIKTLVFLSLWKKRISRLCIQKDDSRTYVWRKAIFLTQSWNEPLIERLTCWLFQLSGGTWHLPSWEEYINITGNRTISSIYNSMKGKILVFWRLCNFVWYKILQLLVVLRSDTSLDKLLQQLDVFE